MTSKKPQTPPENGARKEKENEEAAREEAERKLRRKQATDPALMPIGDPAGAA